MLKKSKFGNWCGNLLSITPSISIHHPLLKNTACWLKNETAHGLVLMQGNQFPVNDKYFKQVVMGWNISWGIIFPFKMVTAIFTPLSWYKHLQKLL